jgi:hypothetical protein
MIGNSIAKYNAPHQKQTTKSKEDSKEGFYDVKAPIDCNKIQHYATDQKVLYGRWGEQSLNLI